MIKPQITLFKYDKIDIDLNEKFDLFGIDIPDLFYPLGYSDFKLTD